MLMFCAGSTTLLFTALTVSVLLKPGMFKAFAGLVIPVEQMVIVSKAAIVRHVLLILVTPMKGFYSS